jgi:hypothetical protein
MNVLHVLMRRQEFLPVLNIALVADFLALTRIDLNHQKFLEKILFCLCTLAILVDLGSFREVEGSASGGLKILAAALMPLRLIVFILLNRQILFFVLKNCPS